MGVDIGTLLARTRSLCRAGDSEKELCVRLLFVHGGQLK